MSITFSVKSDVEKLTKLFAHYPAEMSSAITSSLNKTMSKGKTAVYRQVRLTRHITAGAAYIKSHIQQRFASRNFLRASLDISRKPLPLNAYQNSFFIRSGVRVNIEGTPKVVHRHGNKAFKNSAIGAGEAIFVRTTSKRTPIEKLFGPSIGTAVEKSLFESQLSDDMSSWWQQNLLSQLKYRFKIL